MNNYISRLKITTRQQVISLVAIGLALRLFLLGSKSLWLDEANSLRVALNGQELLWAARSESYHPPFFYWLIEKWQLLGQSERVLRMSAVIPGAVSIWMVYLLGKVWLGRNAAITATALVAFSPILVWYSQELRPYSLMTFLGLVIILAATKLFINMSWPNVALLILSMTAMLYLHYFSVLFIPLQLIVFTVLLAARRTKWQRLPIWFAAIILSVIAYLPWLRTPNIDNFTSLLTGQNNYISNLLSSRFGIEFQMSLMFIALVALIGLAIILPICFVAARWLFSQSGLRTNRFLQIALVALFVISLVVFVVPRGYSLKRQFVVYWPFALIILAWFWPWQVEFGRTITLLLILSLGATLINTIFIPKPRWREVNAQIISNQQSGDIVLLEPRYMTIPFNYYNRDATEQTGIAFASSELATTLPEHERIWFVTHATDYDAAAQNEAWLMKNAQLIEEHQFYRLRLQLFEAGE